MSWGGPNFIVILVAICTGSWLINNWIRAKHGYALEDEWGGKTDRGYTGNARKIELLTSENEGLNNKVSHLEERIAVLERIVTDKPGELSKEIEALRTGALRSGQN